jgi:hypothetical protein
MWLKWIAIFMRGKQILYEQSLHHNASESVSLGFWQEYRQDGQEHGPDGQEHRQGRQEHSHCIVTIVPCTIRNAAAAAMKVPKTSMSSAIINHGMPYRVLNSSPSL